MNVVIASTDVHEFGKEISKNVLIKAGANVFDLGTNVAVEEIGEMVIETESKAVLISTYNGIAYSFAEEMVKRLKKLEIDVPIVMGGRLNEIIEGDDLPVDVSDKLEAMGINADNDIDKMVDYLVEVVKVNNQNYHRVTLN
jgi:methylmalonyl-CoA mutase cobalamin-binding subunit